MKTLILAPFLFLSITLHAQRSADSLRIDIGASNLKHNFGINILLRDKMIKIIYSSVEEVDYQSVSTDKRYKAIAKYLVAPLNYTANQDTVAKAYKIFEQVVKKYSTYRKDSLLFSIKDNPGYLNLVSKVGNTSTDSLENKKINEGRIVFDGLQFNFLISDGKIDRKLFVDAPGKKSHPILYTLIHETLEIYRRKRHNSFLNTEYTEGY